MEILRELQTRRPPADSSPAEGPWGPILSLSEHVARAFPLDAVACSTWFKSTSSGSRPANAIDGRSQSVGILIASQ
jgi:hypothetical protein